MKKYSFDQLYLHVGQHKTGTSALQKFLQINEKVLSQYGILYPKEGRNLSGAHHRFFMPTQIPSNIYSLENNVDMLIQKERDEKIVLMSTESLSKVRDLSNLQVLRRVAAKIKIIIYLRRQDTYFESAYSQMVKKEHTGDIRDLIRKGAVNYRKICEHWASFFGKENIIVKPYECQQFVNHDLFADFLSIFGIDKISEFTIPQSNHNPSLSAEAIYFKRLLNQLEIDKRTKSKTQKPLTEFSVMKSKEKKSREYTLLSPSEKKALLERYAESNAWVALEYLNRPNQPLFYAPLPKADDEWAPLAEMTEKTITEIAHYIANKTPDLFNTIKQGVQNGINATNENVRHAAQQLKPILSIKEKKPPYVIQLSRLSKQSVEQFKRIGHTFADKTVFNILEPVKSVQRFIYLQKNR